jgi:hypothetical protein
VLAGATGCDGLFGFGLRPGTYAGNVPCRLTTGDASDSNSAVEFDAAIIMEIAADGAITINNEEAAIGAQVVRSIPTADLVFVVTGLTRTNQFMRVDYLPTPTLPGIQVQGSLVETYRGSGDSIDASANADLLVIDSLGTTSLFVRCDGLLPIQDD